MLSFVKCNNISLYKCEVWVQSTSLKSLKLWHSVLPFSSNYVGLPLRLKRFTLIKSPLGNKQSKDQFEKREYCIHFVILTKNASMLYMFLDIIKEVINVKVKLICTINFSKNKQNGLTDSIVL